jgi:hypothetical protein
VLRLFRRHEIVGDCLIPRSVIAIAGLRGQEAHEGRRMWSNERIKEYLQSVAISRPVDAEPEQVCEGGVGADRGERARSSPTLNAVDSGS